MKLYHFYNSLASDIMEAKQGGVGMKEKIMLYLWLAKTNLFISAFTFGGGYVVVPMVKKYYIEKKNLFTEDELMEMAAIAQSTPGAIAVNIVSLAGYRAAEKIGMLISCICAVIPPLIILSVISLFYSVFISNTIVAAVLKGMQAGVAALVVDFIVDMTSMILKERSWFLNILVVLSFVIGYFTSINVIFILIGSCLVCIIKVWFKKRSKQ